MTRLLPLLLCTSLLLASCGYQTASQVMAEAGTERVGLRTESVAAEPGMLFSLKRGLDLQATRYGLAFIDSADILEPHRAAMLEVRVDDVRDAPISAAYVDDGSRDAVGATGHELRVSLSATLLVPGSRELRTFQTTGRALYNDKVLALATEQAREAAIDHAMAAACDTLLTWMSAELMEKR